MCPVDDDSGMLILELANTLARIDEVQLRKEGGEEKRSSERASCEQNAKRSGSRRATMLGPRSTYNYHRYCSQEARFQDVEILGQFLNSLRLSLN